MEVNNFSNDEIFEGQKILIPIESNQAISSEKFAEEPNKKIDFENLIFPQNSIGDETSFTFHEIIENSILKKELVRNMSEPRGEYLINNKCKNSKSIIIILTISFYFIKIFVIIVRLQEIFWVIFHS